MIPVISYHLLTIDRFETTKEVLETNLRRTKVPLELLICDNGSKDPRIIEYLKSLKPAYLRLNSRNEGISHAQNQLIIRGIGKYIFTAGNDIIMEHNWAEEMIELAEKIPNCGLIGAECGIGQSQPITKKFGIEARWLTPQMDRIFGAWLFKRKLVDEIGWAHEMFDVYGLEDSDINARVNIAGFNSCYHPTQKSQHVIWDWGENTEYRKMKDVSMQKNAAIFGERNNRWHEIGVREPLPPLRDPLS